MTKQIQTVKPKLFMKKNGDCINIVWVDGGVSVGVGDNDQSYFFNENEWKMLNELLKPTRYSQETSEEKALNQIYELIASVRTNGAYPAESFVGGIIKNLLAKAQQEAVQECYLQCLAVECGEGECSQAIASKFPELVNRLDEENRLDLKNTLQKEQD